MAISPLLTKDRTFNRVTVDFAASGNARVEWSLDRLFDAPGPYQFQLQFGTTGGAASDDWLDVGPVYENVFFAIDPKRRAYGKELTCHYRVRLTTADDDTIVSQAAEIYGILGRRDWLIAREAIRQQKLRLEKYVGWPGKLLKRRQHGQTPDPTNFDVAVTDFLTGEVIRAEQTRTFATPFNGGYYAAVDTHIDVLTMQQHGVKHGEAGQTDQQIYKALATAFPMLAEKDIFVHTGSDRRFEIHGVETAAVHRGVPLLINFELRKLPSSDIAYSIEV